MLKVLGSNHAFSEQFLSYLILRKRQAAEDLIDQLCQCSERRLARVLLSLARKGNQCRPNRFDGISQATLAAMVGPTRSRVNFFMNKFRKLGYLEYSGYLREVRIKPASLVRLLRKQC
jgi:CRP/FNR family cyclic AMP-dependent transcriptional regulator